MKIKQYHWGVIYLFLLIISALLIWLNQHSVNAYWQQTYHRPSYLQVLDDYAFWRKGGELKAWLSGEPLPEEGERDAFVVHEELPDSVETTEMGNAENSGQIVTGDETTENLPSHFLSSEAQENRERKYKQAFGEPFIQGALSRLGYELEPAAARETHSSLSLTQAVHPREIFAKLPTVEMPSVSEGETAEANEEANTVADVKTESATEAETQVETQTAQNDAGEVEPEGATTPTAPLTPYPNKIRLDKQDMVFFAGDSLMQGVAPYVQQWLTANGMKSLNLSKQSTGLSYPKFFNWPATIEETLQKNPEIKLLVMFLGPNDPWDFPHPEKPKSKYLRFKEAEWESVYRQRISHILENARKFNVNVIWLQIPHMRAPKLNTQMAYLNEVLETETHNRALFIPIKAVLSGGKNEYRESILIDGKEMRVRSKDGIHFTPSGMKLIAKHIIQHIELNP